MTNFTAVVRFGLIITGRTETFLISYNCFIAKLERVGSIDWYYKAVTRTNEAWRRAKELLEPSMQPPSFAESMLSNG